MKRNSTPKNTPPKCANVPSGYPEKSAHSTLNKSAIQVIASKTGCESNGNIRRALGLATATA